MMAKKKTTTRNRRATLDTPPPKPLSETLEKHPPARLVKTVDAECPKCKDKQPDVLAANRYGFPKRRVYTLRCTGCKQVFRRTVLE